jgi:penicillin-binding protein 1A
MRDIHQGLPMKDFSRPSSGIIDVTVCAKSGLLKTPSCNEGEVTLPFLEGTQPVQYCTTHGSGGSTAEPFFRHMEEETFSLDQDRLLEGLAMPRLPAEFRRPSLRPANSSAVSRNGSGRTASGARSSPARLPNNSPALSSEDAAAEEAGEDPAEKPGEDLYLPDYGLEIPLYNPLME